MNPALVFEDVLHEPSHRPASEHLYGKLFDHVTCKNFSLPQNFPEFGDQLRTMNIRSDDTWICSFPRSGTAWTQEIIWWIVNNHVLDSDMDTRCPNFETVMSPETKDATEEKLNRPTDLNIQNVIPHEDVNDSFSFVNQFPSRRYIRTHLPFCLLPDMLQNQSTSAKVVYVMRDPKDVCISYYHYCNMFHEDFTHDFEQFCDAFIAGATHFGPYWNHIHSYVSQKLAGNSNILFLRYEDMIKDLKAQIRRTANFMEIRLDETKIEKLVQRLSFDSMKMHEYTKRSKYIRMMKRLSVFVGNKEFIRKGEIQQWEKEMNVIILERFKCWETECKDTFGLDDAFLDELCK